MARINLLPWREELRRERQRQFMLSLLMTAVLGVILVFLIGFVFDQRISAQNIRNQTIQAEIAALEVKIRRIDELEQTRARLLSRKRIIEDLQASRSLTVELLDKMAKSIPVGVTLQSVRQQGMNVTFSGWSQSNARVSAYLQSLDASDLFQRPELNVVRVAERNVPNPGEPYEFTIQARLRSPTQDEDEYGDGYDDVGGED
ncbi:MAG: PilN domain-containing protein [Xanthomonadales bacterium]|nr:PilN domain-containing protein [Xanthomonadales bacterium]